MDALLTELKRRVIERLELTHIAPETLGDDTLLVGPELELDSIDILELVMMLEEDYGVKVENKEMGKKVFVSFRTMAETIQAARRESSTL